MTINTCNCPIPNCGCAGGMHTYAPYYQSLLDLMKPNVVMEWGPGPNTQMALDAGAWVTSVEHDRGWIPRGGHERFSLIWLPICHPQYVNSWPVHDLPEADLYFVDGRRRGECLRNIARLPNAIVCLHDAQRERYRKPLQEFKYVDHLIFGFAIASNSSDVIRVADAIRKGV